MRCREEWRIYIYIKREREREREREMNRGKVVTNRRIKRRTS